MSITKSSMLFNITPDGKTFLRMDGTNFDKFNGAGGGQVNCQYGNYTWEAFAIIDNGDGTFSFESNQFPGCYMRNAKFNPTTDVVNCQYWGTPTEEVKSGPNEKYLIKSQGNGTYTIESNVNPGSYININSKGGTSYNGSGFGVVSISDTAQNLYILPLFGAPNPNTPST